MSGAICDLIGQLPRMVRHARGCPVREWERVVWGTEWHDLCTHFICRGCRRHYCVGPAWGQGRDAKGRFTPSPSPAFLLDWDWKYAEQALAMDAEYRRRDEWGYLRDERGRFAKSQFAEAGS